MKSLFSCLSVCGAKSAVFVVIFFVASIVVLANGCFGLRPHQFMSQEQGGGDNIGDNPPTTQLKEEEIKGVGMEMYPTGSSLPDCSHACGPCFPCKRVMISFMCSVESCPIVYRCACKGRYYHVPSN